MQFESRAVSLFAQTGARATRGSNIALVRPARILEQKRDCSQSNTVRMFSPAVERVSAFIQNACFGFQC